MNNFKVWPLTADESPDPRSDVSEVDELLALTAGLPYRITWKGSKVPRGGEFNGGVIAHAQHGRLLDEKGLMLGSYRRLKEFHGPDHDFHEINAWALMPNAT